MKDTFKLTDRFGGCIKFKAKDVSRLVIKKKKGFHIGEMPWHKSYWYDYEKATIYIDKIAYRTTHGDGVRYMKRFAEDNNIPIERY